MGKEGRSTCTCTSGGRARGGHVDVPWQGVGGEDGQGTSARCSTSPLPWCCCLWYAVPRTAQLCVLVICPASMLTFGGAVLGRCVHRHVCAMYHTHVYRQAESNPFCSASYGPLRCSVHRIRASKPCEPFSLLHNKAAAQHGCSPAWLLCLCLCRPSPAAPTWSHGTPAGGGGSSRYSSSSSGRWWWQARTQKQQRQRQQQAPCTAAIAKAAAAQGAGAMAACQVGSDRREGREAVPARDRLVVLVALCGEEGSTRPLSEDGAQACVNDGLAAIVWRCRHVAAQASTGLPAVRGRMSRSQVPVKHSSSVVLCKPVSACA
jgi:hypothetical protein